MNLKNGKVFTSKFVGTGPSSCEKRIYRAAVSKRLRNTGLEGKQVMKHRVRTGECLTRYFYCGSVKEAAKMLTKSNDGSINQKRIANHVEGIRLR